MIITEHNQFTGRSYNIFISPKDDLNGTEIAECFTHQHPKERAVISFSKITAVEVGLIIVGVGRND